MATTKIKIAYILTPITFGGAEKVSLNFLRAVDRNRFDICPILLVRPWEDEPFFASEIRQLEYAYVTVPVATKTDGDVLRVFRVIWHLYSILKKGSYDLVHTHGYFADICGLFVGKMLKIKSVTTCHGFIEHDLKLNIYNFLDKLALRFCDNIIAVSDGIRDELFRSGIKKARISVIPNSVETFFDKDALWTRRVEKRKALDIAPKEYVIGYLGRLSEEKGLNYLVEAVAELKDTAVKILLVGEGPAKLKLEQKVQAKGIGNQIIFAGFRRDAGSWLPAFDSFVLPSLTEGTPMALLEAMAAGLPVIASAVGGVPKVVTDGINGILIPPGNSQAISEKIQLLKDNPGLGGRLGRAGAETIKAKYSLDSWCRTIESLYSEALASGKKDLS